MPSARTGSPTWSDRQMGTVSPSRSVDRQMGSVRHREKEKKAHRGKTAHWGKKQKKKEVKEKDFKKGKERIT